jgi:hypothetical protein
VAADAPAAAGSSGGGGGHLRTASFGSGRSWKEIAVSPALRSVSSSSAAAADISPLSTTADDDAAVVAAVEGELAAMALNNGSSSDSANINNIGGDNTDRCLTDRTM